MKRYNSKIGITLIIILILVLGGISAIIINKHVWFGLAIIPVLAGLIIHLLANTYYVISNNDLIIKCGFLVKTSVKINSIKKIAKTINPLSAPAASMDRLLIYFGNSDAIMISPKDKQDFIAHLTSINPNIEVTKGAKSN
jgi:hypothetical protein